MHTSTTLKRVKACACTNQLSARLGIVHQTQCPLYRADNPIDETRADDLCDTCGRARRQHPVTLGGIVCGFRTRPDGQPWRKEGA